ncbi:MAG: single-stranded DNA-binding protein [candidate division WOR-3 bacterium]|uniref:Single-stranded DNA-binding protein n=1 Tax=candidate division WOR-3 bacterium TaxID=2052148 RepID=A0A7V4E1N2_UNCW3
MADLKVPRVNYVLLSGRLTDDPQMTFTPKGTPVTKFRIASSRLYKDPLTGGWKEDTLYIDIKTFGELAERCHKRLSKGSPVLLEGRLNYRSWETSDGQKKSLIEIIGFRIQFLEKKAEEIQEEIPEEEGIIEEEPDEDLPF